MQTHQLLRNTSSVSVPQIFLLSKWQHVMIMVDNTTTESILREMGTNHSSKLNKLVKQIWQWCESQGICITMAQILGAKNCKADDPCHIKK